MLALDSEGATIDLAKEVCAADPRVAPLVALYSWTQIANRRYKIYWGQNALRGKRHWSLPNMTSKKGTGGRHSWKAVASAQEEG
ncbi:MAG: hypothetical protein R2932_16825 [Caldilineaceae bacterium]